MIDYVKIENVLFLDIETVSGHASYDDLPERMQPLWKKKTKQILKKYDEEVTEEDAKGVYDRAGIFAEFGKIVCISVGIVRKNKEGDTYNVRLKSFANDDETILLADFSKLVEQYYGNPNTHYMCGHNLKEFDIPYICRRMAIHQMKLPRPLDISGAKPWETKHLLDTLVMWKFGDYKNYTSLSLLTAVFDIPTPKDDIDGSQVGKVYWEENDLKRISVYCEKDVLAVVQLLLRYQCKPLIADEDVIIVK